jgi:hypothetical protein
VALSIALWQIVETGHRKAYNIHIVTGVTLLTRQISGDSMANIVETLKELGIEVSENVNASLLISKIEGSDEFKGLIETKNDLLKFKQDTIASQEQDRLERERLDAQALEERERLAKEKNDFAEMAKIEAEKRAKAEERANALLESSVKSADEATKSKVQGLFEKSHIGRAFAMTMTKTEVDEATGQVVSKYIDGDFETSNFDEFKAYLSKSAEYSQEMKTPGSRTAPASGGSNGSAPRKKPSEMTSQERLELKQSNPEEFRRLFNL